MSVDCSLKGRIERFSRERNDTLRVIGCDVLCSNNDGGVKSEIVPSDVEPLEET